jgi:DNA polymerase III subunit alpha
MESPHNFVGNGIVTSNSFGKAHAFAYAVLCHWTAWFKTYYPAEFLAGILAHVDGKRIPDFVTEARRRGFKVLPPDINESGESFTIVSDEVIRYGFGSVAGIGASASAAILAGQPYASFEDFRERSGVNSGIVKLLAGVGAFDSLVPNRRALEKRLGHETSAQSGACTYRNDSTLGPRGLPCTFDWTTIPVELTKSGKPKANQKGAPSRCTRACWQYVARPDPDFEGIKPYTEKEIRDREVETMGLYLSSSPFDWIPDDAVERCATTSAYEDASSGTLLLLALVSKVRSHIDRSGREMAFLDLTLHDGGQVSLACFSGDWATSKQYLGKNSLGFFLVSKNDRGAQLLKHEPILENA